MFGLRLFNRLKNYLEVVVGAGFLLFAEPMIYPILAPSRDRQPTDEV